MIHTLQVAVSLLQDISLTRLETDADPEEAWIEMNFPWQIFPVTTVLVSCMLRNYSLEQL